MAELPKEMKFKFEVDAETAKAMKSMEKSFEFIAKTIGDEVDSFVSLADDLLEVSAGFISLKEGEEKAADIESLRKLVTSQFHQSSLYVPCYNPAITKTASRIDLAAIKDFINKFEKYGINVTGLPHEAEHNREKLYMVIVDTLANYMAPYVAPAWGAIILQPPNFECKLSIGYVDEFTHITFKNNFEEFILEGINGDLISRQSEQVRKDFMVFVKEVLRDGAYLEYISANLYNCIGGFNNVTKNSRLGKLYYKNTVAAILKEWKE